MGKTYLTLVPKSLALDHNVYPRHAYRIAFMMYGSFLLIWFQINRYMHLNKVGSAYGKTRSKGFGEYVNWNSLYAPHKVRYPRTKEEVEYEKKYGKF